MKILHILYSGLGGSYNVVETLISKSNPNIDNITLYVGPKLNSDLFLKNKKKKRDLYFVRTKRFFSQFFFFQVLKKIKKISPDIIVLHNFQIFACFIAKVFFKINIIYVDHNAIMVKNFKDYLVLLFSKLFVSHYICLNGDNKSYLIKNILIKKNKVSVISNGISLLKIKNKKKNSILKIGMAARMNNKRMHKLILKTLFNLNQKNHKIICYFAGDGENKKELMRIVRENKIKNIKYDGNLNANELSKWYKKLDLYIQASKGEGCSMAILEAISNGTPFIGSNVSGIKNLKFLCKKKILFDNNINDLKLKILKFKSLKYSERKKFVNLQRETLNKYYLDSKMIKKYEHLYYKILNY